MYENLDGCMDRLVVVPVYVKAGDVCEHVRAGEGVVATRGWRNRVGGLASGSVVFSLLNVGVVA